MVSLIAFTSAIKGVIINVFKRNEEFIMTINQKLEALSLEEIKLVSEKYLMGWHDLEKPYGFRVKGLNRKRAEYGLPALTKEDSLSYRIDYIKNHYSDEQIESEIYAYVKNTRMDAARWVGIEILDCRFGREYAKAFKLLLGNQKYRKLAEYCRVRKLTETQQNLYGGVGLAGKNTYDKAVQTNLQKYGVSNVMQNDDVKSVLAERNTLRYGGSSPFCSQEVHAKAMKNKIQNIHNALDAYKKGGIINDSIFKQSNYEMIVFYELINHFGKNDVFYEYGLHPYDARYPFSCDFYIKSLDLFIEINAHYSHGGHWFDASLHDDVLRQQHLLSSGKKRSLAAVKTWCEKDVKKRQKAKESGIRYLVFWDASVHMENKERVPNLKDFYQWMIDYQCDYESFVKDNPSNTY